MTSGRSAGSLALAANFRAELLAEGTVLFLVFVLLAIGWVACREMLLARARAWLAGQRGRWPTEPAWRRMLRIGFGVLWIVDGLLQAQPGMPAGLAAQAIAPAAQGSPGWVLRVVGWGTHLWSGDPVAAAVGAVWIQLGVGIWLVSASSPRWSRLAGLASAGWGLTVWVFGEAFGGLLAPGVTWLMGAPGAALFYIAAGGLVALPVRYWRDPRLGRAILQASGALLAGFAVLQAWPGRGYWQGTIAGHAGARLPGPLAAQISAMASAGQPTAVHDLVGWFGAVTAAHGFAVNLVAVIALAAAGAGLLTGRPAITRPVAGAAIGFFLADWVLVQDFGIFGGVGTDPNSMVPQALILMAGLLAAAVGPVPLGARAPAPAAATPHDPAAAAPAAWPAADPASLASAQRAVAALRPVSAARRLSQAFGTASASAVLTLWAIAMLAMGATPMAMAAVH